VWGYSGLRVDCALGTVAAGLLGERHRVSACVGGGDFTASRPVEGVGQRERLGGERLAERQRHVRPRAGRARGSHQTVGEQVPLVEPACGREGDVSPLGGSGPVDVEVTHRAARRREEHVGQIVVHPTDGRANRQRSLPQVRGEIEVVHTQIDERPAVGRPRRADPQQVDGERRLVPEQAGEHADDRIEALRMGNEEPCRTALGQRGEGLGFGRRGAERLFDEDMPPGREGPRDRTGVRARRGGDDDHLGAGDRLFLASQATRAVGHGGIGANVVGAGDLEPVGEGGEDPDVP
jgi:hypothetical protein